MGLDIYLRWYNNFDDSKKTEKEYEKLSKINWNGNDEDPYYSKLSDEEREMYNSIDAEIAISLGLDEYGCSIKEDDKVYKEIDINHPKYPDHYFSIGYFRSSYNEGGIQRILKNLDIEGLEWIFDRGEELPYEFKPDWELALERVKIVKAKLENSENIRCHSVSSNMFSTPNIESEKEAIKVFLNEKNKASERGENNYSNSLGNFYLSEPMVILATIPGREKMFGVRDCTYIITKSDNTWYIEALEIVESTIEYVLNEKDTEKYYLAWSA